MADAAPGPWNWEGTVAATASGGFQAYIIDATGRKIAAVWGKADEKKATAHLMAAAPSLASAAKALVAKLGNVPGAEAELMAIDLAVADAEGRGP